MSLAPSNSVLPEIPSTSARLRIVHAVFSSRIAGSERYCIDLANQQAAFGHDVHVIGKPGSAIAHDLHPSVRFHGVGKLFRGWRVRQLVKQLRADVCHGHLSAACKIFGSLSSKHVRVGTLHVGYKPHQHGRLDGVICVNRAQSRRLEGYTGAIRTIPNWLPETSCVEGPGGIRAELGLDENTLVISCVGRLHESKGADLLLSAFRAVAPKRSALVFLGEGPQRAQLEQQCAGDDRVHFLGYRPRVTDCLRDCNLFVSPSREESFGLAIIEAMSMGLPVIATMTEGPLEYLQDQPVTLVPIGDVPALSDALAEAVRQFEAGQLSRRAYDLSNFHPASRVGDIIGFYQQLIAAQASASARPQVWAPHPATAR